MMTKSMIYAFADWFAFEQCATSVVTLDIQKEFKNKINSIFTAAISIYYYLASGVYSFFVQDRSIPGKWSFIMSTYVSSRILHVGHLTNPWKSPAS